MNGLSLARDYYAACRPILLQAIPDIMARAAVGLAGEGSECLGCDDARSRDHDFGPAFCLWLPRAELRDARERIDAALARLPREFHGLTSRFAPERRHGPANGRVGPLAIEDFYAFFTGLDRPPSHWREWLRIPEYQLAACTSGEVFEDGAGEFSRWREALLACYPRDVRLKKLAARCMVAAQAGQYNLPRSLERGDGVAAMLAAARFAEAALSLVFLCNRRYMPFYKWAGRLGRRLPILGEELGRTLDILAAHPLRGPQDMDAVRTVEDFCAAVAAHLRAVGLSTEEDSWLWAHGPHILRQVENEELRRMDMLQG
ncbi:DUF4037 domain-containing protein [uncultured Desulfovibrio sp.]|uniref:DUF4037 domain-containing protein n=1 Tax=uncultured Desulfovibrio sp. TaxID=167968 RepID=UPI00259A9A06|nr:DUF4037 domain-containing protein [uncultured Desulfovibrio sp.]